MKLNQNQKHILHSGGLWGLYDGLTAGFLLAYALALGANNTIVGILGAVPFIAALVSEMPGAKLLENIGKVRVYGWATSLGRLAWLGIIFAPVLFAKQPLLALILFYFLSRCLEYLADPAWTVLVADEVQAKIRGEFIAKRTRLVGIAAMVALVAAGWYLDFFSDLTGFMTMFAVGIGLGLLNTFIVTRVKDGKEPDHLHHGFREFFTLDADFRKYLFFVFCFNFAFMLASPFFTAYILSDLRQSYTIFALSTAVAVITKIFVYTHMGRLADKYGDKPVLLLSVMSTALVPITFLFITPERIWLLWFGQIMAGITWAGYDVSIFNMFINVTTPEKRAMQTATYNIITSIPLIIAPVVAGFIADNIAFIFAGIPLLFAISAALRFLSSLFLFSIPEKRVKYEYPLSEVLMHAVEIHPSRGVQQRWVGVLKGVKKRGMLFTGLLR
ncbi:MFS transporter [Candidatus Woesearchaeota archaeon]|nr:MFS transporter [Candidatus Woesearchaeota archaeon]